MTHSILIVDDSATTRSLIRRTLQIVGFDAGSIKEAADGGLAMNLLESQPVDLVLADLHMPNVTGVQLVQRMQADARFKHIPVLIISAEPSVERLDHLRESGAKGYLRKPFTPEDFRAAVRPIIGAAV